MVFHREGAAHLGGNWTFVVVTDRTGVGRPNRRHLFRNWGAQSKKVKDCQAQSRAHLRELLSGKSATSSRSFTSSARSVASRCRCCRERRDIIVITDEAHRSQYDQLAANMRRALPNAAFLGFTGTPLMAGEERTSEVFGDYVSVYNFAQSVADGATVPLYLRVAKARASVGDGGSEGRIGRAADRSGIGRRSGTARSD